MQPRSWQWRKSVESAWFYAFWFSIFGLAIVFVVDRKYGERQAGIERRFQARTQAASQPQTSGGDSVAEPHKQVRYSSPDDTLIPLWPLGVALALVAGVAAALTYRAGLAQ